MEAIKALRGCGASGKSLLAGAVYAVPKEVSQKDAEILVRLSKAEWVIDQAAADQAAVDQAAADQAAADQAEADQAAADQAAADQAEAAGKQKAAKKGADK